MLNRRTIALLLAAALLLPLASCAKTENDPAQSAPPSDTAPAATEPAATEPAETEPPRLPSNLPDLDASLGNSPVAAIPISASEGGATASFILEAMSYESYDRVLPVFYDNYLTTRLVRDEESVEMLRIIHDTLYYDIGALFNWGNLRIMIEDCCAAKNPPVSQFAKSRQRIQSFMEKTLEKINA